jgi:hypothetical protein
VESVVRALLVKLLHEGVELGLLLQDVGAAEASGLLLQGHIHALMTSVLLGMTKADAFHADAQGAPDRQPGGVEEPVGEAKATPLSERMARGKPRSLKSRSKAVKVGCS